jgi:hypothetical protein
MNGKRLVTARGDHSSSSPLKAETRVRIPLGPPPNLQKSTLEKRPGSIEYASGKHSCRLATQNGNRSRQRTTSAAELLTTILPDAARNMARPGAAQPGQGQDQVAEWISPSSTTLPSGVYDRAWRKGAVPDGEAGQTVWSTLDTSGCGERCDGSTLSSPPQPLPGAWPIP